MTMRPRCLSEGPKSNFVTTSRRYVMYWTISGLSRPYLASNAACAAGETAFSLMNGPPGTACITKKVTVMTTQTVSTANPMRFSMYFRVFGLIVQTACLIAREGRYPSPWHDIEYQLFNELCRLCFSIINHQIK